MPTVSYRAALSRERSASQERAANESRTTYGSGSGKHAGAPLWVVLGSRARVGGLLQCSVSGDYY